MPVRSRSRYPASWARQAPARHGGSMWQRLKQFLRGGPARGPSGDDPLVRSSDLERLDRLRRHARERATRDRADARYRMLLVGGDATLSLEQRSAAVAACTDRAVLAYVARSAREESLRRIAVDRLDSPRVLMEVALNDPVCRLRRHAVTRIDDPECLEAIAQDANTADQRVARDAGRRLRSVREAG